jgi:hypothetical protein
MDVLLHHDLTQNILDELRLLVANWLPSPFVATTIRDLRTSTFLHNSHSARSESAKPSSGGPTLDVNRRLIASPFKMDQRVGSRLEYGQLDLVSRSSVAFSTPRLTCAAGSIVLGAFEILPAVIPHPLKNFEITPQLVLEATVHSVAS